MALHDFIDIFDMPDLSNMKEELFHHMLKEQDLQHLSFDNLFKEGKNRIQIFATQSRPDASYSELIIF